MAVAVKLSLADQAFLRKAHRTNAAIFMDQRLFLRRVYRAMSFPYGRTPFSRWMLYELTFSALMSFFSWGALRVKVIFFIVQHLVSATSVSSYVFSTCMEGRFSHRMLFEFVIFRLDQRPFFLAESISSGLSSNFSIFSSKPVALFSVIFCDNLKYPNFRLIAPSHFRLIAYFLIRLKDNFRSFLFSDIYDIHTYMHTLFSHIRFWPKPFPFPQGVGFLGVRGLRGG